MFFSDRKKGAFDLLRRKAKEFVIETTLEFGTTIIVWVGQ